MGYKPTESSKVIAPKGSGVTKLELKPPSAKAVQKYDRTALDVNAVEKRELPVGSGGSAVRKLGSTRIRS